MEKHKLVTMDSLKDLDRDFKYMREKFSKDAERIDGIDDLIIRL